MFLRQTRRKEEEESLNQARKGKKNYYSFLYVIQENYTVMKSTKEGEKKL